jgi:hypothetical protein
MLSYILKLEYLIYFNSCMSFSEIGGIEINNEMFVIKKNYKCR